MELKTINKILAQVADCNPYNISVPRMSLVSSDVTHEGIGSYGESQGEYDETTHYFSGGDLPENIFLQISVRTDCYGNNDFIAKIQFVEGKKKTITVYEPV